MNSTWKKCLSIVLVIVLMVQLMPIAAFSTDGEDILIVDELDGESTEEEISVVGSEDEGEKISLINESNDNPRGDEKKTYVADDVLWENRDLREEGIKHFHLSDGTDVAVVYEQPVHYMDGAGVYQDIDNSLELVDRDEVRNVIRTSREESDLEIIDDLSTQDEDIIIEEVEMAEEPVDIVVNSTIATKPETEESSEKELPQDKDPLPERESEGEESSEDEGGEVPADDSEGIDGEAETIIHEEPKELKGVSEKEYRNRAGLIDVSFAEVSNAEDLVSVSDGKNLLIFTPNWTIEDSHATLLMLDLPYESGSYEAAITPRNLSSGLRYEEVYPNIDLEYWVYPCGIKEEIILREPTDKVSFAFTVNCGDLIPSIEEDGSICFLDYEGTCIMQIPTGSMTDVKGELSTAVYYELEDQGEGKVLLTVHADENWLNEIGRAYPVSIDPSVLVAAYNYNNGLSSNYVRSNQTTPGGMNQVLYCGYGYNDQYHQNLEYRVMLGFDQLPTIAANCMVVRSVLYLHQPLSANSTGYSGNGKDYYIHQVNMPLPSNCSNYASWINYNLVWSCANGDNIATDVLDYISASHSTANVTFACDVTRAVKNWYGDASVPHALCVKRPEINSGGAWLAIQGYAPSFHVGPALEVYYRNFAGLEDYYSYQSHSIDRAGTGYIGDYSGQLTLIETDTTSSSTVCPVAINHVYNSAYHSGQIGDSVDGVPEASGYEYMCVGQGWKLNIQQSLIKDTSANSYAYFDADGTVHYFTYDSGSSSYKDEDGLNLTVTEHTTYNELSDRYGNKSRFTNGLLSYSEDANGNRITYNRDSSNRVTSVTRKLDDESVETVASLAYNGNYLRTITDSAGWTTTFTYTDDNGLSQITHADGTTVNYTYDSDGRLLTAKDNESGYSMTYTYNGQSRISGYTEKAGSTTGASVSVSEASGVRKYQYCGKDRTLGNSDDFITYFVFDYYGRTITRYTTDADGAVIFSASGGKYTTNEDTNNDNNRLLVSGSVGMRPVGYTGGYNVSHVNLLSNGEMVSGNGGWSGATYVTLVGELFSSAAKLTGAVGTTSNLSQTVTVNAEGTKTYIFSGWAKASSVALTTENRSFALRATINYSDNTSEVQESSFCADSTNWQYNVLPIVPKESGKTVSTIEVEFTFDRNPNTAYFTYASLTEEYAASFAWDNKGNLVGMSSPDGVLDYEYAPNGVDLELKRTIGNGDFTYTYDDNHNITSIANDGQTTLMTYDACGNALTRTLTNGSGLQMSSNYSYTNNGNLMASETDTRGKTTNYTYGNVVGKHTGQPTKIVDPRGTDRRIGYNADNGRQITTYIPDYVRLRTYYTNGLVSSLERKGYIPGVTDAVFQNYYINHNSFGQTTSIKVENRTLASYAYASHNGVLNQMTYGNGQYVTYGYDNLERVKNVYYNGSSTAALNYVYWGEGQLKQLTDSINNRTYNYTYDNLGRRTGLTEKYNGGDALVYDATYDTANRVSAYSYRISPSWNGTPYVYSRVFTYGYNSNNGSLTSYDPQGSGVYAYTYDGLRRLTQRQMSRYNSVFVNRNYTYLAGSGSNTSTLVSGLTNKLANGDDLASYSYSYDNGGNITAISGITAICGSTTISDSTASSYTYDVQGQMLTETRGGTTYSYTYDSYGNIRSKTKLSGSGTDTYTYGDDEWADLLTAYNGLPIIYDAIGNPTTWYDGTDYTWVNGRQLESQFNESDGLRILYTYDADGLRLTKTVQTVIEGVVTEEEEHRYLWLDGKLISEAWDDIELEFFYDESGSPYCISCIPGAGLTKLWYFYVTNLQGDVVALLNANGVPVTTYKYDAWGYILTSSDTSGIGLANLNPLRYRGYYYDSELGFYYLNSRYYDPAICRFINADDATNLGVNSGFISCNLFVYCGNNPVSREDDGGEFWHIVGSAVLGGVISAGFEIASQLKDGASLSSLDWTSVGIEFASGALTGVAVSVGLPTGAVTVSKALISAGTAVAHGIHENKDPREIVINAASSAALSFGSDKLSNSIASKIHVGKHEQVSAFKQIKINYFCKSDNVYDEVAKELVPSGFLGLLIY